VRARDSEFTATWVVGVFAGRRAYRRRPRDVCCVPQGELVKAVLVFAASHRQFKAWYAERRGAGVRAQYVHSARDVIGKHGREFYFVEHWENHGIWKGASGEDLIQHILMMVHEGSVISEESGDKHTVVRKLHWMLGKKAVDPAAPLAFISQTITVGTGPEPELHTKPARFASFDPRTQHDSN
jgi:hypothetical protein